MRRHKYELGGAQTYVFGGYQNAWSDCHAGCVERDEDRLLPLEGSGVNGVVFSSKFVPCLTPQGVARGAGDCLEDARSHGDAGVVKKELNASEIQQVATIGGIAEA